MKTHEQQLDDLKNGVIVSITVEKENFLSFREVLVQRKDFKHFRGIAQQGGMVSYSYDINARS
ncbi:hypothetical protein [Paenisporosarcina sp. TG20]|uniref:hypothetical protein n=1 Tax=Paenisporosarcina sp. TG20 TaxID=1211706 RepID=UPI0002DB99B7|nr:hypothetical protein [Paenisporosarcina sp. TG20]